jgi:hypothetical protein
LIGGLPGINFNQSLQKGYALNFKAESRFAFASGSFGEFNQLQMRYILTDVSATATKRIGPASSIGVGYLARLGRDKIGHRLVQQYVHLSRFGAMRMAQRLGTDQNFLAGEAITLRVRYRFTAEIPLNGEKIDAHEFYLKPNAEVLYVWQGNLHEPQFRLVPILGYVFTDNNRVEMGVDYRLSGFSTNLTVQTFWFVLSWYIKN